MLQTLRIENVALIKSTVINFDKGLNVLLGETGSGKSLVFNSLLFVLGAKADKSYIRNGEQFMRVEALFVDVNEASQKFLSDAGFDYDGELLISRILYNDGKSSIRVNGMMSTVSMLKELSSYLVDSYAQHESVELLNNKNHIYMLDKFIGKPLDELKSSLGDTLNRLRDLNKELKSLGGDGQERERLISLLKFQYEEIIQADIKEDEVEKLQERLKVLNSSEKIFESLSFSQILLSENPDSILNQLEEILSHISSLVDVNEIFQLKERIESVKFELEDINGVISEIKDSTYYDERELEELNARYDLLKNLCKKYGGTTDKVLQFAQDIKEKLEQLEDSDFAIEKINKEKEKISKEVKLLSEKMTDIRGKTAIEIENKVAVELSELGMKSANFKILISPNEEISSNGQDDVKFTFSANIGQDVKDLSKTASGGELSRFMLAVKNIMSLGVTQTLLFDEIDSGISGEIGKIVGKKLKNISKINQVICITHLPQVASFGDNFINIYKIVENGQTFSMAKSLQGNDVVQEIAKMISGNCPSQVAIKHAYEMIEGNKN